MKVLIINKFLYPNGGSETYIFELGKCLARRGDEVQYFGMEHAGRLVGNAVGAYTSDMDFHGGSKLSKLTYPVRTIYSAEAREKLRLVLDDFRPDVCHLNNFNYQLTPSVILEIVRWREETGRPCRIVYTAHDYQLVCPNHMLYNPGAGTVCERCLTGRFGGCVKGRCIHGSAARSLVGAAEAAYWRGRGVYRHLDAVVCCSRFLKTKLDQNPVFADRTVAMHNFVTAPQTPPTAEKGDYVLYFGRFSAEKGIRTLLAACRALPDIPFVFAGTGPLEGELAGLPNVQNVGFQSGAALTALIAGARLSVYPSEWYENCPLSVMESQLLGTPVLGADIGGIPELIDTGSRPTGALFPPGDADALTLSLRTLWDDPARTGAMARICAERRFDTADEYVEKLMKIYTGEE